MKIWKRKDALLFVLLDRIKSVYKWARPARWDKIRELLFVLLLSARDFRRVIVEHILDVWDSGVSSVVIRFNSILTSNHIAHTHTAMAEHRKTSYGIASTTVYTHSVVYFSGWSPRCQAPKIAIIIKKEKEKLANEWVSRNECERVRNKNKV